MDTDHRLIRAGTKSADRSVAFRLRRRVVLVAGLLMAGSIAYGEGGSEWDDPDAVWPSPSHTADEGRHHAAATGPLPVIVVLAVDAERADATSVQAIATVRNRLLDRMRDTIPDTDYAVERTYENFPLISLSVAPVALGLLIAMPEVKSIEANRTHALWDPPPSLPPEVTTSSTDWNTE